MSDSKQDIVVYKHSSTGETPDVLIMTREQLKHKMTSSKPIRQNNSLRLSHKHIPRGHRHVEILQSDLIPEAEREKCADRPNMNSSIATITLPNRVWMQRQITADQFADLHILSV
ncbi:hypothetical protein B0J12DRAFT_388842 [Macrophomina phaseolina]|uniref:Uncharacterized protein n=1 Tax=Macrophomina phaseolina TaxID=35725 RepID=A0ABQ8FVD2_9PEZI|nr:hypothetical protein B0J12DRAFT_388842 [Macrophomina phaseolina]